MDLAEEEDRLRDEWVTYRQQGFFFREASWSAEDHQAPATDAQRLYLWFTTMLVPPPGATQAMADEAREWARRWVQHVGRAASRDLFARF